MMWTPMVARTTAASLEDGARARFAARRSAEAAACVAPTATCWLSWSAAIPARWQAGLGGVGGDGREASAGSAVSLRDQRGCRPRCGVPALSGWPGAPSPWTLGSAGLMGDDSRRRGGASGLTGRRGERGVLDQLINAVRAGGSRVLVVRGEPGVGKSALLDYLAGRASGCRVVRAAGVESEMELAFAGLHQLLAPVLDRVGR